MNERSPDTCPSLSLSHSSTLLKSLDEIRCHLETTFVWPQITLPTTLDINLGPPWKKDI